MRTGRLVHRAAGHRAVGMIFMLQNQGMLLVNTLQGFFSFLPISLAVLGNQPLSKMRLSLPQSFLMLLQHEAMACTATLQAAPARLHLSLLWAITC